MNQLHRLTNSIGWQCYWSAGSHAWNCPRKKQNTHLHSGSEDHAQIRQTVQKEESVTARQTSIQWLSSLTASGTVKGTGVVRWRSLLRNVNAKAAERASDTVIHGSHLERTITAQSRGLTDWEAPQQSCQLATFSTLVRWCKGQCLVRPSQLLGAVTIADRSFISSSSV